MDYQEAEDYLYSLPRLGLEHGQTKIHALLDKMGNPERELQCVQVAGTNGKGSTTTMIAAILKANGFRTGKYLSPHLDKLTERIQIDGKDIPCEELARMVSEIKELGHECTFFEVMTAVALKYFVGKTDYCVLEVGLGGRLDATTVVNPRVCVITNIDLEHTHILGNTIAQIASEKAGIIKQGSRVITAEKNSEALDVFRKICTEKNATLVMVEKSHHKLAMLGEFQQWNAACAVEAVKVLGMKNPKKGLSKAVISGRMEKKGNVLMDVGHNPACIRNVKEALSGLKYERLFLVFGAKDDKDVKSMLYHLPDYEEMFVTQYRIAPNGMEPMRIREILESTGKDVSKVSVIPNVAEAFNYAKSVAKKKDLILVTGSTFIVSEARGLERQICS